MQKQDFRVTNFVLGAIALVLAVSLFLKAIMDMDTNYDVGWYHLPFAARIWNIVPEELFISGAKFEYRYDGFPLLAHFLQGFLWKITGRVQAANLVCYFSVIIYLLFLRSYLKIPLYISTIAIFTIPAVTTHAATGFVDLPGNIGASVLMMMIYCFFKQSKLPDKKELSIAFLGAATAANTKPQLQPLVFVLSLVVAIRLIYLYFKYTKAAQRKLWIVVPLSVLASILIFATPTKNVLLYGNPFYPIKIEIAGVVLNHQMTPKTYSEGNRPRKWLRSVLEINTPKWSADQSNRTENPDYLDRAGGFFGAYVVFNLLLLFALAIKEKIDRKKRELGLKNEATIALFTILLVSLIPANFPQSHELRYLMFWMITLVSLNLYLGFSKLSNVNWFAPKYLKLIYLLFFIIMCIKIESFYLKPDFRTLQVYLDRIIDTEILSQISPGENNCVISRHGFYPKNALSVHQVFYYNSYFHPDIKSEYSIKVADDISKCGNINIIPKNP